MKFSPPVKMLIVLLLLSGCRKKLDERNYAVSFGENFSTAWAKSAMNFPENGDTSAELYTDIRLSLPLSKFASILGAHVFVSGEGEQVPGKTIIAPPMINFVADRELSPKKKYTVRAFMAVKAGTRYAGLLHTERGYTPNGRDTVNIEISWTFTTREAYTYSMHKACDTVTAFSRDGNKIIQIGDSLYCYGGWTAEPLQSHNDVYRSGGDLTKWERLRDAPWEGRHTFGIGKMGNDAYIFGGDHLSKVFDIWKTTDGVNFSKVSPDLESRLGPRIVYGACVHNNKLYILGGQSSSEPGSGHTDVWTSDNGRNWERIATKLPFLGKNISGCAISFNNRLWVVGGGYYTDDPLRREYTNEIYSSEDGVKWRREPDGPWQARQYADLCVWNNRLWMIAGYNRENLSDIWYMTTSGEWQELVTNEDFEPRHASGLGVYDDKLVIVCGNYHNDCWVIEKD